MNLKTILKVLSLTMVVSWPLPATAQAPQAPQAPPATTATREKPAPRRDPTRDSFLDTRPKEPVKKTAQPAAPSGVRLGLGYTIFKQAPDGGLVRASSEDEFHTGDRLRLVIEPNADGYLYVFNSGNDGEPKMIFPNPRLNAGRNRVVGHVQYEVPSSMESNSNNRWFEVLGEPATEHLYFVISRTPLAGVPTGTQLLTACGANQNDCAWRPAGMVWLPIVARLESAAVISRKTDPGHAQSGVERESASRGIKLPPGAPEPSVIMMNNSPQTKMLALKVDLIHK